MKSLGVQKYFILSGGCFLGHLRHAIYQDVTTDRRDKALIANIGSDEIKSMGCFYVIIPILTGIIILFVMALLFNNLSKNAIYSYK